MGLEMVKYIVIAAVVIGSFGSLGYAFYRSTLQTGYHKAREEQAMSDNYALIENQKEISRLVEANHGIQNRYQELQNYVDEFGKQLGGLEQRLLDQQADFDKQLATASGEALSAYAKALESNLAGCRADVRRFSVEAASCSATAHAFDDAFKNNASKGKVNEPISQY